MTTLSDDDWALQTQRDLASHDFATGAKSTLAREQLHRFEREVAAESDTESKYIRSEKKLTKYKAPYFPKVDIDLADPHVSSPPSARKSEGSINDQESSEHNYSRVTGTFM